jgi:hypothetical protein
MEACENIIDKYVKPWKHTKIIQRGEMPLATLEELESEDTLVSIDGDRIFYLVKEGNISHVEYFFIFYVYILNIVHTIYMHIENDLIANEDKFGTWSICR